MRVDRLVISVMEKRSIITIAEVTNIRRIFYLCYAFVDSALYLSITISSAVACTGNEVAIGPVNSASI